MRGRLVPSREFNRLETGHVEDIKCRIIAIHPGNRSLYTSVDFNLPYAVDQTTDLIFPDETQGPGFNVQGTIRVEGIPVPGYSAEFVSSENGFRLSSSSNATGEFRLDIPERIRFVGYFFNPKNEFKYYITDTFLTLHQGKCAKFDIDLPEETGEISVEIDGRHAGEEPAKLSLTLKELPLHKWMFTPEVVRMECSAGCPAVFTRLPIPGRYTVSLSGDGIATQEKTVTLTPEQKSMALSFFMEKGVSLLVHVGDFLKDDLGNIKYRRGDKIEIVLNKVDGFPSDSKRIEILSSGRNRRRKIKKGILAVERMSRGNYEVFVVLSRKLIGGYRLYYCLSRSLAYVYDDQAPLEMRLINDIRLFEDKDFAEMNRKSLGAIPRVLTPYLNKASIHEIKGLRSYENSIIAIKNLRDPWKKYFSEQLKAAGIFKEYNEHFIPLLEEEK